MSNDLGYTAHKLADIATKDVPANMRLARIIRKASAKGSNGKESQGLHLPAYVFDAEHVQSDTIREYVQNCIMDVQDKIARKITDSGRNILTDEDISISAVAAYLEESDESIGRLSGDKISKWFDATLAPELIVAFADKLGVSAEPTAEEAAKLDKVLNQYRDVFASMASKAPSVAPAVGNNLLKALDMIPADSFSLRIRGIVDKAMKPVTVDMLGL